MCRERKSVRGPLLCGGLGCLCFGAGDWLMLYGDTAHEGGLAWLTVGAAGIAPWRNALAMALAFPGILLYGVALFALAGFLKGERPRRLYHFLTAFSLTPWLCLHLLYCMILYGFAWMGGNGYAEAALPVSEALFAHFSWLVIASEVLMLPPYLYWFWASARGNSVFPKAMALSNPLVFYALLKLTTAFLPDCAFRLAFTNGLMSESMLLWFATIAWWSARHQGTRRPARPLRRQAP